LAIVIQTKINAIGKAPTNAQIAGTSLIEAVQTRCFNASPLTGFAKNGAAMRHNRYNADFFGGGFTWL
jgi:hypothetical protein